MNAEPYTLRHPENVCSPALIYYEDIIRSNTEKAIGIAGNAERLWPHVKSHKMAEMIRMQMDMGIRRFKCATISELKMVADCGAAHVLMAYPLVGPNIGLFLDTAERYPNTAFYAIGDSVEAVSQLSSEVIARGTGVNLLVDVNMGMDRTGVAISRLPEFCRACAQMPGIRLGGFHCYDGQIHDGDPAARKGRISPSMEQVMRIRADLVREGMDCRIVIAGGSPTFPCHAEEQDIFLSPGTVFLWDYGYAQNFGDLPFQPAAAILTRVISHPADGLFTLDLGYKGIASDPSGVRGIIVGLDAAEPVLQSEEHWVFRMKAGQEARRPAIGEVLYVIPTHICPTSALYAEAVGISGHEITGKWTVTARNRDSIYHTGQR